MKTNKKPASIHTHEGAKAKHITSIQALRRSVLSCFLWEKEFYESGQSIADRINVLCGKVTLDQLANLAIEARKDFNLRHVPLLLLVNMLRLHSGTQVGKTITEVINRPDELTELLSLYWAYGRVPLDKQLKLGLAGAFRKFSAYQFAKYNRNDAIKLRDVMRLCHPKAANPAQNEIYKQIMTDTLPTPDTWEVALSAGNDKRTTFERLMNEKKLGSLAFLRNLRNMSQAGVNKSTVANYATSINMKQVLPFRYISAARAVPHWEDLIETLMLNSLAESGRRLFGKTVLLIDNSGSMTWDLSTKSDINRADAAGALAILLRSICEDIDIYAFSNNVTVVPPRQGFALAEAIRRTECSGTRLGEAVAQMNREKCDRLIVLTDEQSATRVPDPTNSDKAYIINVASAQNGIGYGAWTHIDGFSESVVDFIQRYESEEV